MHPEVLVPIADGSEELEAVTIIDVLRRAGARVTVASTAPAGRLEVTASRGVKLVADKHISDCRNDIFDLIVIPGGMPGAEHLRDSAPLTALLKAQFAQGKAYGAICAAPQVVLAHHGLLANKNATGHPGFQQALAQLKSDQRVVIDGNVITSQGPGTALEFSLALVEFLYDADKREFVAEPMVL